MDKAKQVKKLAWMNRYTIEQIAKMVGVSIPAVSDLYKQATGHDMPTSLYVVGHDEDISNIKIAISTNKHVILHGPPGTGKTISAIKAIHERGRIMNIINISDNRTGPMLGDQLFGCHRSKSDIVYLFDEIDSFDWRSHAYFKKVLEESEVPIIMTCNDITKVGTSIVNHVKKNGLIIKFKPPTLENLEDFITTKFPMFEGKASDIYCQDFREVLRRIVHGWHTEIKKDMKITTEHVVGAMFGEKRFPGKRLDIIKKSSDHLSWAITWADYNAASVSNNPKQLEEILDCLSQADEWARKTSPRYLATILAAVPCPGRKRKMDFPAPLFNAEKRKEPEKEEDKVIKIKVVPIKEENIATSVDPFGDF